MPRDAPADTAGPSSPPPRMPDGWLPQWEGVQRKWYYVQRATGKSQWEIPTEPVILTPSTTPTSIGTGPSQAPPSRPSTNSPQVSGLRGTLAERIEAAADSARTSSSLDAQLDGQPRNIGYGPSGSAEWYPDKGNQHPSHPYGQNVASSQNGYGQGQHLQEPRMNTSIGSSNFYTDQSQSTNPADPQSYMANSWGHNPNDPTAQAAGFNLQHHAGPYSTLAVNPQASHQMPSFSPSAAIHEGQAPGPRTDLHPPQPEWRVGQQQSLQRGPQQDFSIPPGLNNGPQPYLASNGTPASHPPDWPRGEFAPQPSSSSNPLLPGSNYNGRLGLNAPSDAAMHMQMHATNAQNTAAYPLSRSQSHHATFHQQTGHALDGVGSVPSHGFAQQSPSYPYDQYNSASMARNQSGTGFNSMVFPPASETQNGAQYYQNPLVQTGMHQYLHQQKQQSGDQATPGYSIQNQHAAGQQNPWATSDPRLSRSAASDPQFISGPWGSSPGS